MNSNKLLLQYFNAKLLLFGEYAVLYQGKGLYMPLKQFGGKLSFQPNSANKKILTSTTQLKKYALYLTQCSTQSQYLRNFNIQLLLDDIEQGLFFDSTIPQGYGIGSSGALCAALYHRYAYNKPLNYSSTQDLITLQAILAKMEHCFHGKSTGLDALACYLGMPMLMQSAGPTIIHNFKGLQKQSYTFFLVDTGQAAATHIAQQHFMTYYQDQMLCNHFQKTYVAYSNQCIDALLQASHDIFWESLANLSYCTISHLSSLIPASLHDVWKQGLKSKTYYLKLCGSGGGGFILGCTQSWHATSLVLQNFPTYHDNLIAKTE